MKANFQQHQHQRLDETKLLGPTSRVDDQTRARTKPRLHSSSAKTLSSLSGHPEDRIMSLIADGGRVSMLATLRAKMSGRSKSSAASKQLQRRINDSIESSHELARLELAADLRAKPTNESSRTRVATYQRANQVTSSQPTTTQITFSSLFSTSNDSHDHISPKSRPLCRPARSSATLRGLRGFELLALAVVCLLLPPHFATDAHAAETSPASESAAQLKQGGGPDQRSDLAKQSSGADAEQQKSIVASLSSAVASAAAAAAVAAAQNSLSPSDARSGGSGANAANHHPNQHQSRASTVGSHLNGLAIKIIADAIPEVPYNILHNMKKLDHAAPFYNVPHKFDGGAAKESSSSAASLIVNALSNLGTASGNTGSLGAAAEHLSNLFKSPLWKRISEGYGEFASEFRGLFRAQQPTPMKGPSGSTATKLLRDISVPALLMLVASSIPSDWRPGRTRRKQSGSILGGNGAGLGGDQLAPVDPMALAASSSLTDFQSAPQFMAQGGNFYQANSPQVVAAMPHEQQHSALVDQQQVVAFGGQQQQQVAGIRSPPPMSHNRVNNWSTGPQTQVQPQPQQQASIVRRSGEQPQVSPRRMSLGSLTSAAAATVATGKLMSKIMNANGDNQRLAQLGDIGAPMSGIAGSLASRQEFVSPVDRSDHAVLPLGDKHKYSVVSADDGQPAATSKFTGKPRGRLLSAMTHALGLVLTGGRATESGYLIEHRTTINQQPGAQVAAAAARRQSGGQSAEQRDLSQLVPASWKEVVKRTVNNVQQQASSQWKSIEGQLTNWVQDKLKSFPAASGSAQSSSGDAQSAASAPVSNLIASVSSSAMSFLNLGNKSSTSHAAAHSPASPDQSSTSASKGQDSGHASGPSRSSAAGPGGQSPTTTVSAIGTAKAALVGVADMIVNTLTSRNTNSAAPAKQTASPSGQQPVAAPTGSASPSSYPTQQSAASASWSSVASETPKSLAPASPASPAAPAAPAA